MHYFTSVGTIDPSKAPFSTDVLEGFQPSDYEHKDSIIGTVNLDQVVGLSHGRYIGASWGELKPGPRSLLKRGSAQLDELRINPAYYLDRAPKKYWSFYEVDGNFYISTGVHRTITARYFLWLNDLPQVVHGVVITQSHRAEWKYGRLYIGAAGAW